MNVYNCYYIVYMYNSSGDLRGSERQEVRSSLGLDEQAPARRWDEHLPNQGKFLNGIMTKLPHNWTTLYAASCDTFGVQRDPGVILGVPAYNIHS